MFHLRATANMIGVLFIRSFERAEMVTSPCAHAVSMERSGTGINTESPMQT